MRRTPALTTGGTFTTGWPLAKRHGLTGREEHRAWMLPQKVDA